MTGKINQNYNYIAKLLDNTPNRVQSSFFDTTDQSDLKNTMGDAYFKKIDPNFRNDAIAIRNYLRNAYFSIVSINSVISDVEMCARMIGRYPWHGTDISKGDHFEFVWSNFTNHCYIFEERTKQLGKHFNEVAKIFNRDKINVGPWIKKINKEIGEHIAFRGAHIHVWSRNYEGYEHFKLIDSVAHHDVKYKWAQKYLYIQTKPKLKKEILDTREKMIKLLLGFDPDPVNYLLESMIVFDNLLQQNELQS